MYDSFENRYEDFFSRSPDTSGVDGGVFTELSAPTDLLDQTRQDGLSLPAIAVALRRWALQQEDVEKVAVSHAGEQYSVAILFTELQSERVSSLYAELNYVLNKFGEYTALLYPLGPTQRDSLLLKSADCHVVYPS